MNKVENMLIEVERRVEMMQVARRARKARPVLWRKQDLKNRKRDIVPVLFHLDKGAYI